jgi:hypothetical protein
MRRMAEFLDSRSIWWTYAALLVANMTYWVVFYAIVFMLQSVTS